MRNVMVALPNIDGALCSTPNSRRLRLGEERKKEERKIEITGQKYNGLPYYIGRPQLQDEDVLRNINRTHAGRRKGRNFFVTGDLDLSLDIQTRPSEGPNTSSM